MELLTKGEDLPQILPFDNEFLSNQSFSVKKEEQVEIGVEEAVLLSEKDTLFFGHYFFPKAMRQKSPPFHRVVVDEMENVSSELSAVKIFRGGAKTTLARVVVAKRVAFGISRTILIISETAAHSLESLRWLRRAIENNERFTNAFRLKQGDKWTDERIDIFHETLGITITIVGVGIFGQTRGLNIDDYRPDFILLDDIIDEDNSKTPEMRKKVSDRLGGAILQSLAPRSESPLSKAVMLQTPLHRQDEIEKAMDDPAWSSLAISVLTAQNESVWPERWSTKEVLKQKEYYRQRNQLSVWYKEKEVTVTADELSYFTETWLRYYEINPVGGVVLMSCDPTPPPKDSEQLTSNVELDDAVVMVARTFGNGFYILDYYTTKSPTPTELISKIFEFHMRYKPLKFGLETVLFQRVLKSNLETEMQQKKYYFAITPVEDKRKKSLRIRQAVTNYASQGMVYVKREHGDLIDQFLQYPDVNHDDLLDALSIILDLVNPMEMQIIEGEFQEEPVEDNDVDLALVFDAP